MWGSTSIVRKQKEQEEGKRVRAFVGGFPGKGKAGQGRQFRAVKCECD